MKGVFVIYITPPTIQEINTVHKEKSNYIEMSQIYKQYLKCWLLERSGFFGLEACLVIFAYWACQ